MDGMWTITPNGDPFTIETPEGRMLLLRYDNSMTREEFVSAAYLMVKAARSIRSLANDLSMAPADLLDKLLAMPIPTLVDFLQPS